MLWRFTLLTGMMGVCFIMKVTFELRLGGGEAMNHADISGKCIPEKRKY